MKIHTRKHCPSFFLFILIISLFFVACDEKDKDKDIFGFEGVSKNKILDIEVVNTQNESLLFKTDKSKSIFQSDNKQPTLLFFISKECSQCQDELLHILDLYNKYQEFISIIAISPKDDLLDLQKTIDEINPRFKLYAPTDNKNLLDFLYKDDKQSYIALYDKQGEKVIDYVGLVPEEMVELDIVYQIQDQLDAKAQREMQTLTQEEIDTQEDSEQTLDSNTQSQSMMQKEQE